MSRRGNCWDNAVAESFFSSLKKEHIKKKIYKNRLLARVAIAEYIEKILGSPFVATAPGRFSSARRETRTDPDLDCILFDRGVKADNSPTARRALLQFDA